MSHYLVRVMNKDSKIRIFDNVLVHAENLDQAEDFAFYFFGESRVASIDYVDYEIVLPDGSFIYET